MNYDSFICLSFFRNLRIAFRDPLKPEGIYLVNPSVNGIKSSKNQAPLKLLSVDGLKKALRFVWELVDHVELLRDFQSSMG